ncbi:MAG: hypothetical protein A2107_15030 [Verrucomicrobia bacterium GWF2_62_7]|nr:MAG: hypothetical protein A2107_15030 [Verrucomicrobia bacterium GWF2_62_7]
MLGVFLRIYGTVAGLAIFAVFMPRAWMAATHEMIGLGKFPDGAIVDYLARSVSALYAFHGGLLWILARDVRRYATIIAYVAAAGIAFSVFILALDVSLGLPVWWILGEGPSVFVISLVVLALLAKERAQWR